jgi:hypothetical protein
MLHAFGLQSKMGITEIVALYFTIRMTFLSLIRTNRRLLFRLLPPVIEGSKLLGMIPDVGEDALALLDTSRSFPIQRAEIRSDRTDAFKDAPPTALDRGQGHKGRFRYGNIIGTVKRQLQQLLLTPRECKLRWSVVLKKPRSDGVRIGTHAVQRHFQEQTVGLPLGFRVCAAKVFESVNDPERPEATHMPQIDFIDHLRKNPGEAVACKQLLIRPA